MIVMIIAPGQKVMAKLLVVLKAVDGIVNALYVFSSIANPQTLA